MYLFRCKYSQQSNSDTSYGSDLYPVPVGAKIITPTLLSTSGVCVKEEDKKEEGKNLTIHFSRFSIQAFLTMTINVKNVKMSMLT